MNLEEPAIDVFLTNSDPAATQVTSSLKTTGATVYCIVPGGLTGPQQLTPGQGFGNENLTGVFDFILQPASMARRAPLASTVTGNGNGPTPLAKSPAP